MNFETDSLLQASLVQGASDDCPAVMRELLDYRAHAQALALRLTGSSADAEDIVQAAYLRALQCQDRLQPGPGLRSWFLCVVSGIVRDNRCSEHRRALRNRGAGKEELSSRANHAREDELHSAVQQALNTLDPSFRLPLSLHYEQGLSYADAARIMDVPEGTMRKYAQRGLQMLREKLHRQHYEISAAVLLALLAPPTAVRIPARPSPFARPLGLFGAAATVALAVALFRLTPPLPPAPKAALAAVKAPRVLLRIDGIVTGDGSGEAREDDKTLFCKAGERRRVSVTISGLLEYPLPVAKRCHASIQLFNPDGSGCIDASDDTSNDASTIVFFQHGAVQVMTPITWKGKPATLNVATAVPPPPPGKSLAEPYNTVHVEIVCDTPKGAHTCFYFDGKLAGSVFKDRGAAAIEQRFARR